MERTIPRNHLTFLRNGISPVLYIALSIKLHSRTEIGNGSVELSLSVSLALHTGPIALRLPRSRGHDPPQSSCCSHLRLRHPRFFPDAAIKPDESQLVTEHCYRYRYAPLSRTALPYQSRLTQHRKLYTFIAITLLVLLLFSFVFQFQKGNARTYGCELANRRFSVSRVLGGDVPTYTVRKQVVN